MSLVEVRRKERAKYGAEYYRSEYWKEDLPGTRGNRGLSYNDPDHRKRFHLIVTSLLEVFEFNSILDAGCGTGRVANSLAHQGKAAHAMDFSVPALVASANEGMAATSVCASVEALPFRDEEFDLVWCSDVMEHLPGCDIFRAALEVARVARRWVALTINLDNPYYYHPTILPRSEWLKVFRQTGLLDHVSSLEAEMAARVSGRHPEYSFFVFSRRGGTR